MTQDQLVKELKDAGFPLKPCDWQTCGSVGGSLDTVDGTFHYPTLSELIEACGEGEFLLRNDTLTVKWHAEFCGDVIHVFGGNGSTPEEAVARLWLALNKKV